MNRLKIEKQEMIMKLLVEGSSVRSIERVTGVHRDTIIRLMKRVGARCEKELDTRMRGLEVERIQADEIWTYVMKHKRYLQPHEQDGEFGDQFVYIALDADTKLIPCYVVGKRTKLNTLQFMWELRRRVKTRKFQLTTDSFWAYEDSVDTIFGIDIDYGQLIKVYGKNGTDKREGYSPSQFVEVRPSVVTGNPDRNHISTSYVESQNFLIRSGLRRFTRLTNGYSKKLECLKAALAVYFWHYNFVRRHSTPRMTPAMAAGLSKTFSSWKDVLN